MSSISFDRAAEYYDATRGYPPGVAERIADAIAAAVNATPETHFLELGIGTGRIALPLIVRGYPYAGIDLAPAMLAQLRAKLAAYAAANPGHPPLRLDLREGDSTQLPYPDATFDVALTVHVLHLISNWRAALDEAIRVLKLGGYYLNCGDEVASQGSHCEVQDLWLNIVKTLEPHAEYMDKSSFSTSQEVKRDLEARGLQTEKFPTVTWTVSETPRQAFDYIRQRLWSRTWLVPDELFAESIRQLEGAVRQEFGAALDIPVDRQMQFAILRARKPE